MTSKRAITRRSLVAGASAGAVVLLGCAATSSIFPAPKAAAATDDTSNLGENARPDTQYGFMVRLGKCTNCQECVRACRRVNHTPDNAKSRRKVTEYHVTKDRTFHVSTSCMHCEHPACAQVCPAGAITKGVGGIVTVNHDRCIGCKYCYQACPFSVPTYTSRGMEKSDACMEAGVKLGEMPYCVRACKFHALSYGPLDELEAAASATVKHIDSATGPSFLLQ